APKNGFRTFLILWSTQSLSVMGSMLTFFAITIYLTQVLYPAPEQRQALAAALSAVSLAHAVPLLLITPIAGAWADRNDRKRTMVLADLGSALLSLALIGLILSGKLSLIPLVILIALASLCSAFHGAAFDTAYSMLVPREQLPRANGMMQTTWALSGIVAPGLSALIISLGGQRLGAPLAIGIDGASFVMAALVASLLAIPSPKRAELQADSRVKRPSIWVDVRFGARYIWQRRPLLWLLGTFALANMLLSPGQILVPLLLKDNLAVDLVARGITEEKGLALLFTAGSLGAVLSGIVISTVWGGLKQKRVFGVIVPMIVAGLANLFYGSTSLLYVGVALAFLAGTHVPVANAHSQAIWQTQVPFDLQGRVFSIRRVIAQFTAPLMTGVLGWAAGVFNAGTLMAVMGGVMALFALLQCFNPIMLRVEDQEYLESLAANS
ncbi:MAG TPA: MFS transporter, partial [Symbiobacteriaceae bacterium]|nr:MFS transporter [Symbiobacteriaceae bacterium]